MAANPNTISAGIQETWDNVYQVTHHKIPVYPAISNFRLAAGLRKGDTVHRQYRNTLVANTMGADGSFTRQAITDTDESLVINKEKEASFYIKELDEIQNHLPTRAKHAFDASVAIFNQIDGDVLGEYDQFTNTLDDGDLGGTAGNGLTVTAANVRSLFSNAMRLLQRENIMLDNTAKFTGFRKEDMTKSRGVAVISPDVYNTLIESLDGKDSSLGDQVGINGHVGRYYNFDIFVSNALGWSATLALATNPTDGDTIVINGVTVTFVATLSAASGASEVHIASTVDITRANLVEFLNAAGANDETEATDTGYSSTSAANQILLGNMTWTNDNTADTATVKSTGRGFVVVSETFTDGTDTWTAAKQVQHCLFGVANSIDVVIQKTPSIKTQDRSGFVGVDVVTWAAYGYKVFNESKVRMIDAQIRTDAY